ncbi:WD40-repeat-containing domain protein [Xylaria nigripes]|nr:WD40-repeat-containing domain protein [Xylaria nigripes]
MADYGPGNGYNKEREENAMDCDEEQGLNKSGAGPVIVNQRMDKMTQQRPRGPPTPSMSTPAPEFDQQQPTGSPPPPPTPAASPGPTIAELNWSDANDAQDFLLAHIRHSFETSNGARRNRILADLLRLCTTQQLSFVHQFVSPLLKKDPFTSLPDELCLRVLSFIDDPQVLARASQVSRRWRDLLSDDVTWRNLCVKHDYGRGLSEAVSGVPANTSSRPATLPLTGHEHANQTFPGALPDSSSLFNAPKNSTPACTGTVFRPKIRSYKSHFKQRYLVESAWRTGGHNTTRTITQDGRVVTSLHLTPKYIVVALDNAKIHIFDREGNALRTLQGHVMGVWAMVPWEDILVSGGCDRDVRVWNMSNGGCMYALRGHTSTVRCLKMSDARTAISGSRDTFLRVWDIKRGVCKSVLAGHQASVRCLEIKGDIVVSGSYDATAKIWSISEGRCLHTLTGHFSQIYAIAFDGQRVVTGSLDTSVRVWDAHTGEPIALLQGHTSLVGQLQLRGNTLVTGGSDGSVRVWSLERMCPIHRLAAHDNSVTSLQFDDTRIVSGGSDGRVKVWDVKTGHLVRELIAAESVWRVVFEDEKCVAVANRGSRVMMEVWSFSPPEDANHESPTPAPQRSIEPQSHLSADYPQSTLIPPHPKSEDDSNDHDVDMSDVGVINGDEVFSEARFGQHHKREGVGGNTYWYNQAYMVLQSMAQTSESVLSLMYIPNVSWYDLCLQDDRPDIIG